MDPWTEQNRIIDDFTRAMIFAGIGFSIGLLSSTLKRKVTRKKIRRKRKETK